SDHQRAITTLLRLGLDRRDFEVTSVSPDDVPRYLQSASAGLSFRKATFSQTAASPTKIPEYLAAGIPVISNAGIGDTDQILLSNRVGIVISRFNETDYIEAVRGLDQLLGDPGLPARCRASARAHFDLTGVGGPRYCSVYGRLKAQSECSGN